MTTASETVGPLPLTDEAWREYDFWFGDKEVVYRIDSPVSLYYRKGGTTHRIVDAGGMVHCLPAVGEFGCVLRWMPKSGTNPVAF